MIINILHLCRCSERNNEKYTTSLSMLEQNNDKYTTSLSMQEQNNDKYTTSLSMLITK